MKKLDIEQAEPIRKKFTPDWEIRKGKYLFKKVAFDDYNQTLRFLMAIEKPQIKLDHFADFMNFYNELTIAITTHDVGGLTQLDFELALHIDKALKQMGARQLEENFAKGSQLDSLRKFVKSQREPADQVLYQMMMAPDTYGHEASNFVRSWYEDTKEENGLNDVDSALEIMVDQLGLNENFADGKKKGKSRPGRVKKSGASCNGSVTALRKRAKNASGEKARMYHWCANMKSGRKKK
jgi:4a-hydroxytetrahydrobiopterin dehydratase